MSKEREENFEQGVNAHHIEVMDDRRRNSIPTGRVSVRFQGEPSDLNLAHAAGYNSSHFGFHVERGSGEYNKGHAMVHLYND